MKTSISIFTVLSLIFLLLSCNKKTENKATEKNNSTKIETPSPPIQTKKEITCENLLEKEEAFKLGETLLEKGDGTWNLGELDTSSYFSTNGHFVNKEEKHQLIIIEGSAGLSAGNASNLWILLSCDEGNKVIFYKQAPMIDTKNIKDLNGDGIDEIIEEFFTMWMGSCYETYSIVNFVGGKQNTLYKKKSFSHIECGGLDYANIFSEGDTLVSETKVELKESEGKYSLIEKNTYKISTGGKTDDEITEKLKVTTEEKEITL